MSSIKELIVMANAASVEQVSRNISVWGELIEDEGAKVTIKELQNTSGTLTHSITVSHNDASFSCTVRSKHPYCSFGIITVKHDGDTYTARSTGTHFIIKDVNGDLVDDSDEIHQLARVMHARISQEL